MSTRRAGKEPLDPSAVSEITHRLNNAATLATVLMTQIDDGDISAEMQRRFSDVMLATKDGIEQARQLDDAFSALMQTMQWQKTRIEMAMQRVRDRQAALKTRVKDVIAANPDVVFRDSVGTKVFVKNSNPALKFAFELASKSISGIVPEDFPPEFTEPVSYRVVNKRAVREALDRGERLHFAWLEQGQSLQGL